MGVRDLIEVMRVEALSRLREERKKRKEFIRIRLFVPTTRKGKTNRLERGHRLL